MSHDAVLPYPRPLTMFAGSTSSAHRPNGLRDPSVSHPDMRHLDGDRHPVDQHDLVRPVELVRLAGGKAQRYIGFRRRGAVLGIPHPGVATNRVAAALTT